MKKTILHFIFDLARGGAETMLVRTIKELPEYNNIVVTLYEDNHFKNELQCSKYICLNQRSLLLFPLTALKLRRIIKENKVDIVHTHLFWPTIIARMGVPKNIPLISTIHAFIATSVEYKFWFIRLLDKATFRLRPSVIVAVAQGALKEYFSFLKIRPYKTYVLYTFVDMTKFCTTHLFPAENRGTFRLVSIGALRLQKNHRYLVDAFKLLREENIELHIFGMGPFQPALQKTIDESNVNIILKGEVQNMQDVLPQYDLFVMSSTFEGFSLAVLETMAVKVPMLLSDIVSFREQCSDTALYFDLGNPEDFAIKVKSIKKDQALQQQLSNKAYERVKQNFTLEHHMERLRKIYIDTLNDN